MSDNSLKRPLHEKSNSTVNVDSQRSQTQEHRIVI